MSSDAKEISQVAAPRPIVERIGACPECDYSFEGLRPAGHCPECGLEYDERSIVLHRRVPRGEIVGVSVLGLWVFGTGFARCLVEGTNLSDPNLLLNGVLGLALAGWLGYMLYRNRRHGIYVAVLPAGFSTNLSHFGLRNPIPWTEIGGARINGRYLDPSAAVRLIRPPMPGTELTEIGIRGFFRDVPELEQFVAVVNERAREASGRCDEPASQIPSNAND